MNIYLILLFFVLFIIVVCCLYVSIYPELVISNITTVFKPKKDTTKCVTDKIINNGLIPKDLKKELNKDLVFDNNIEEIDYSDLPYDTKQRVYRSVTKEEYLNKLIKAPSLALSQPDAIIIY
jgi:hypothetical protein